MTCQVCGRYVEPDPETGYDACEDCPHCKAYHWGGIEGKPEEVDPIESDLHDLGSVLASLADLVKDCHDPAKLFDVYSELGKLSKAMMELEDKVGSYLLDAQCLQNAAHLIKIQLGQLK